MTTWWQWMLLGVAASWVIQFGTAITAGMWLKHRVNTDTRPPSWDTG